MIDFVGLNIIPIVFDKNDNSPCRLQVLLLCLIQVTTSFLHISKISLTGNTPCKKLDAVLKHNARKQWVNHPILLSSSSSSLHLNSDDIIEYTNEDVTNMRELIFSLSKEETDEDRRLRLTKLFKSERRGNGNGIDNDNDESASLFVQFAKLFDETITTIGGEMQSTAKKNELEAGDEYDKTSDERQLWALVDMMVQSKVLYKNLLIAKE